MNRNKRYYNESYKENSKLILEKLDKIDNDINSNPFTKLFRKNNFKYIIMFLLTCFVMLLFYICLIYLAYDGIFNVLNTFEILGNGFYWIFASIVYFGLNAIFKGVKKRAKK